LGVAAFRDAPNIEAAGFRQFKGQVFHDG
jgi:hypothetical protein